MSKPELVAAIREEILAKGPVPFARFMEASLYHPEYGYYPSPGEKIGWKGDYYTSSSVHPVFGALLGRQLIQMGAALDGQAFTIVEVGAGKGTLCYDILNSIRKEAPEFFARLRYVIVEESRSLKEKQIAWLSPLFPETLRWEEEIPSGLIGAVLSNELLDAFPVHRLRVSAEGMQEIFVDWKEDRFVEVLKPPSSPELSPYLNRLGLHFDRPVDLEVNLRALEWIRRVARFLCHGYVITIDYGYPAEALYSARRPKGTLLCYYKHTANETPYLHVGEQDITAHVDFTSLAKAGEEEGLSLIGFTDQTHFLMGLGIAQRMEESANNMDRSPAARQEFLAMKRLMAPEKMGKIFKILIQGKKIPAEIQLDGLRFKPFFKLLTFFFLYLMMKNSSALGGF